MNVKQKLQKKGADGEKTVKDKYKKDNSKIPTSIFILLIESLL